MPERAIIITADDDLTEGNPGLTKATEAAKAVRGKLAVPVFRDHAGRSDFNDMHAEQGLDAVRAALSAVFSTEKPADPRVFHFMTLIELLAAPRPTKWLIRKFLEISILGILFGEAGSMKSFLAIDQGLCIASGLPWHGHACPNPGSVFYLAGEGFAGISRRIKAWCVAHGVDPEKIPFFTSNAPAQLLDEEHARIVADAVAALAEKYGPPRLVIVDTLNRNFGDGDENNSRDMTAFVASLDRLKARFDCAVLVVHHSGLAEKGRSRGSSVLRAAADFEYKLTAKDAARVLSCTKCKDHEPPADMAFEPETVELPTWTDFETMEPMTSCVLRLTDMPEDGDVLKLSGAKRIALESLREACEAAAGPVHVNVWRDAAISRDISTSESRKVQTQEFRRSKERLLDQGFVEGNGEYWNLSEKGLQRLHNGFMKPLEAGTLRLQRLHPSLEGEAMKPSLKLSHGGHDEEPENPFAEVSHG
jgi:hypothetical protein